VLVRSSAVGVTSLAGSRRAAGVTGSNGETLGDEVRVAIQIDGGKIPVKGLAILGVLELEDTVLVGGGGHLDRDTATIGVDLPVLAVGAATGVEGLHGTGVERGAPQINVGIQVVHDLDTSRARGSGASTSACGGGSGSIAGHVGGGHSSSSDSKDAGDKNVGELHLERLKMEVFKRRKSSKREVVIVLTEGPSVQQRNKRMYVSRDTKTKTRE